MSYTPTNWKNGDVITAQRLNKMENGIANAGSIPMLSVTYAELLAMRNAKALTPGMQYRITDYVCTTTQDNSRAVSHPFDIIVIADDTGTLNENARACLHDGDNYYSAEGHQADLSAWELKYCIDNDTTRFAWADTTNGKGVIYWLKDDRNNECPYDFKQIQFMRYKITECTITNLINRYTALEHGKAITAIDENNPVWCFTFSLYNPRAAEAVFEDASIAVMNRSTGCIVYKNVISTYLNYTDIDDASGSDIYYLSNNVFINTLGCYCYSNTFGAYCLSNTFSNDCYSNTFGAYCSSNTFGAYCLSNTFGNNCYSNTFDNSCYSNTFSEYCYSNTFGNNCYSNIFRNRCQSNTFGNNCNTNIFNEYCSRNTFGNGCSNNIFGNSCFINTFKDSCQSNTFGNGCSHNTFENGCYSNTFGHKSSYNTFNNSCYSNTFKNDCFYNTLENYCCYNTFGEQCYYIDISAGTSSQNKKYYRVLDGVQGTNRSRISITGTNGNNFVTYVGKNSSDVLKTWVPADLLTQ